MKWIISIIVTCITFLISYITGLVFSFTSFSFSWVLNFLLMAWYTFLASRINPKLDAGYFKTKPFERGGSIYKYLGVHIYRKLLIWVGWESISRNKHPVKNDLNSLKSCEYHTRSSELGHTIIALIVAITTLCIASSFSEAKWLVITNILLNIYPIMVQRFNRSRYNKLIHKKVAQHTS